jgi:hypothetical protein
MSDTQPKPWYKEGEMIVALCALIVSLGSLVMMFYASALERQAQRATVWPHLNIAHERVDGKFALTVTNAGVGPAIIKQIELSHEGVQYQSWRQFIQALAGDGAHPFAHSYLEARTLSSGETVRNISLWPGDAAEKVWESKFDFKICYCSILEDCWVKHRNQRSSVSVDECPIPDDNSFTD